MKYVFELKQSVYLSNNSVSYFVLFVTFCQLKLSKYKSNFWVKVTTRYNNLQFYFNPCKFVCQNKSANGFIKF